MVQECPARLEEVKHPVEILGELTATHMFDHAHTRHLVVGTCMFEFAVVEHQDLALVFRESCLTRPLASQSRLGLTESNARRLHMMLLYRMDDERTPPTSNI